MYAVIFKATLINPDANYTATAERLRNLALEKYGCKEFTATTEGTQEIAISYWDSEADILAWKNDPQHQAAQTQGRQHWYQDYQVQVVKLLREYGSGTPGHESSP